jgi:nucleoside-diphosphate-sugar epimerase
MRTAVTGATGLLGGHLVAELERRGNIVVPLSRGSSPPTDVMDPDRVRQRLEGCQTVYHLAARVGAGASDEEYRVNVEGTRNVLQAADRVGAGRLVHVSSLAVMGEDRPHVGTDETAAIPDDLPDAYSRSKADAERLALGGGWRVPVVVVRPGWIWGPGDPATAALFRMVERGRWRFIGDGANLTHLTYVGGLAGVLADLAGIEPFPHGEVFNITDGGWLTMREFVDTVADVLGVRRPTGRIPRRLALAASAVAGAVLRGSSLTPQNVRILSTDLSFPPEKAGRALGYAPPPDPTGAIRATVEYLRRTGVLQGHDDG